MEYNFNFQVCTTKEQSKSLIELGLDINSADMHLEYIGDGIFVPGTGYHNLCSFEYIPAWSLSRLIEIYRYTLDELPINCENPYKYIIDFLTSRKNADKLKNTLCEKNV